MMRDMINPRQVIVVTCRGNADIMGKAKLIDSGLTVAWHAPLSFDPELYGIAIAKTRFSCRLIQKSKVFAVNFLLYEQKDVAMVFGNTSGQTTDKFAKSGATKEDCTAIDCCRIKEAAAYFECEVIDEFEVGDHIFFVGKVLKKRQEKEGRRLMFKGDTQFTSTV